MPDEREVIVTQEDREAAAAIVRWQRAATEQWQTKEGSALQFFVADFSRAIMQGIWDEHPVVQSYARHRARAEAAIRRKVIEEAATIADNPGFFQARDTEWDSGFNDAKRFIAAAIRSLALEEGKDGLR